MMVLQVVIAALFVLLLFAPKYTASDAIYILDAISPATSYKEDRILYPEIEKINNLDIRW